LEKLNIYLEKSYSNLLDISKRITSNRHPDYEDLLHETILALYNSDKEKIKYIIEQKKLTFYIVRIMMNQYHSNTSPYHKKYRKQYNQKQLKDFYIYTKEPLTKEKMKQLEEQEDRLQWIEDKLKHLSWFDVEVFKIYYRENYSLNTMSKATKINRSTLGKSIRYIKNYLKGQKND
jgi:RNA polymerase sigma factor (sigma-70 family)|tara:strand:- start:153 stop:680 length:528 start_codon:yes stop_codon:yes gene_type:complete